MKSVHGFSYFELFKVAISKPLMAQIEVTRNCNQNCFFCFRKRKVIGKYKDKSIKDWQKAISGLVSMGIRELNFSGGEVLLFRKVDSLFSYAKKRGVEKVVVNTNGTISLSNFCLKDIDEIVFSVHGIKDLHDKITGALGSFSKVEKSINYALKSKCRVGVNTVVNSYNLKELGRIYQYFEKLPLIYHAFNLIIDRENLPQKIKEYSEIIPVYLSFVKKIPQERRKLRHGLQSIIIHDQNLYNSIIPLSDCAGGKYKLVIDHQGAIYPCRYFQSPKYLCGNIFNDDLKNIWEKGKGFRIFRDITLDNKKLPKECKTCYKKGKCVGGCLCWRIFNSSLKAYGKDIRCQFGNSYIRS